MKVKILFQLLLILSLSYTLKAQDCPPYTNSNACEDGNGISTDPDNLLNPHCPNLKNNFEWRVKHTPGGTVPNEYYIVYDESGNPVGVRNPFNDAGNHDYAHLDDNHNSNYHPEDGWELLKVDFGALSNFNTGWTVLPADQPGLDPALGGAKLPYMILYNKYTGTFRFFGTLLGQMQGYETVKIELRIPEKSPNADPNDPNSNTYQNHLKATNLLSIQGKSVQPLDQETDEASMVVFAKATNNVSQFFWFDIPVAYDPCLCNIRSQLDITFTFVKTANIDLNGTIDGAIKTETKPDGTPYGVKVFNSVIAAGVSTALAIKTGGAVINFQAYSNLIRTLKDNPNLSQDQKDDLEALANFADCGAKFGKVIKDNYKDLNGTDKAKQYKAANKILDGNTTFLTSLASGCNKKDNAATTINATAELSGSWTETIIPGNTEVLMAMPGSDWSDKQMQKNRYTASGKTVPAYPTYNERLGTFALLKTPRVLFFTKEEQCEVTDNDMFRSFINERVFSMKMKNEDLEYTFNPLLNINPTKTTILARFVIHKDAKLFEEGFADDDDQWYCNPASTTKYGILNMDIAESSIYKASTPYMPLDYIGNMPMRLSWHKQFITDDMQMPRPAWVDEYESFEEDMFIQFKIVGESYTVGSDGTPNDFIQIFTYPVEFVDQSADPNAGVSNQSYVDEIKEYDQDVTFGSTEDLYFTGPVIISAKLATTSGAKIRIYSLNGFEIEPGVEISPDIELIVGPHFPKREQPERTFSEVSSFCGNTNEYKAQVFSSKALLEEEETYQYRRKLRAEAEKQARRKPHFEIYPNPATDNINMKIEEGDFEVLSLQLIDATGSVIETIPPNERSYDILHLPGGFYFIKVLFSDGDFQMSRFVKVSQ